MLFSSYSRELAGLIISACTSFGAVSAWANQIHEVEISHHAYHPEVLTIQPGDSVVWKNLDRASHSVTERHEDLFDSGLFRRNEEFTLKFDTEGHFDYFCTLHPRMTGRVIVQSAIPEANGGISDVR